MSGKGHGNGAALQSNLKALRVSAGFSSLRNFEKASGITRAALSRWERGKELPFRDEIDVLEAAIGERPKWFVEVSPPERILGKR